MIAAAPSARGCAVKRADRGSPSPTFSTRTVRLAPAAANSAPRGAHQIHVMERARRVVRHLHPSNAAATAQSQEVALIVGGGPGISSSCARLFTRKGMKVAIAARTPDKAALKKLEAEIGIRSYRCDVSSEIEVQTLFQSVRRDLGEPNVVMFNVDGRWTHTHVDMTAMDTALMNCSSHDHRLLVRSGDIFRKAITEAEPALVKQTLLNSAYGAFLVASEAARGMLSTRPDAGHKGSILVTGASASFKGYPKSGAFAMASHGKSGLCQSMARELMPQA